MLLHVSLRLQSRERSCVELADMLALEPTDCSEKGLPVSGRSLSGPMHTVSTCVFESGLATDQLLDAHVEAFAPALAQLRDVPEDVWRDLVIAAEGRSLGSMLDLGPASIGRLAQANCGIVLDLYNDDEHDG